MSIKSSGKGYYYLDNSDDPYNPKWNKIFKLIAFLLILAFILNKVLNGN